jgi:quercetin dioxygenase-like cupin family protein
MKERSSGTLVALGALLVAAYALAQPGPLPLVRLSPESLSWTALGDRGVQQATIVGDPTASGLYAQQLRFPAGLKVEPHYHSGDRVVVVISGTFYVGFGDRFDEATMNALPAGSTWTEPNGEAHYAWAKDGEVVLHTVGIGPLRTTQIPSSP